MSKTSSDQFEQLVMQCKSSVYSVCYMFADSLDMADDLFQVVLINLWNGFGQVKDKNSIKSWVYRVSLNTCISYKRKKRADGASRSSAGFLWPQKSIRAARRPCSTNG